MKFHIITIFPEIFQSYFGESILKRAQEKGLINIKVHNLRDYTKDKHKKVDDTPYGGGAGMVMQIEPIWRCVESLKLKIKNQKSKFKDSLRSRVILFSAKGKKYTQKDAQRLSKYNNLIFICGRYEGVDERVAKYVADEEISIGDYVLTGGEIPAMVLVDSISRLVPGVLGNPESLKEESFSMVRSKIDTQFFSKINDFDKIGEYPQYTKPEIFFAKGKSLSAGRRGASGGQGWKVPKVLLSGNHKKIEEWREKNKKQ